MRAPIHRDSRRAELAGDAMKFFYCFFLCVFALNFWLMFTPVAESSVPIYRASSDSIGVLVKRDRYTRQSMNTRIGH